ncbi:MAG TPA: glucosamine-6-phosphate deaminase [Verrucomicrobiales bacterium]|nr:glucosamine-6-phosphate deaminase [Verrucomicrobiales bacterium]
MLSETGWEQDSGSSAFRERFEQVRTVVYPGSAEACRDLAAHIRDLVESRAREGRMAVLGLATGSTPVPLYRELIRLHREEGLSFGGVITFNLDEYYGLEPEHPESYRRFMADQLFDHVDLPADQAHLPDGSVPIEEAFASCAAYEEAIVNAGGIDLQILGIGRSGHIGFNEPGSKKDSRTRLIALDRITRRDAAADFLGEEKVPRFAVTMGVGTILEAREIVLLAWGENKAEIVAQAVEGAETEAISASFLQSHPNARFVVDAHAASALTRQRLPWLVGRTTWNKPETRRAVAWLAGLKGKPVLKLVDDEYNETGMGELLTREGSAYDLNIRIFNELQHTITGWPGGKPNADDTNRPEKALPWPKRVLVIAPEPEDDILSMGGTMERLVRQGHELHVLYQTSGSLRVSDDAAAKFASILRMLAEQGSGRSGETGPACGAIWEHQGDYAAAILAEIERKGTFGEPSKNLRLLKALIRRGEARDSCGVLRIPAEAIRFLDLPFYENGRYRRFVPGKEDEDRLGAVLSEIRPDQIYATGHLADPSSVQGICFELLEKALAAMLGEEWLRRLSLWLYRGHQQPLRPYEVEMAVPMSPVQLETKVAAIGRFQTHNSPDNLDGEDNRGLAKAYDRLGLAEYEAIEGFERSRPLGAGAAGDEAISGSGG